MKILRIIFCFCLIPVLLFSCERTDYNDEIRETYRQAKTDLTPAEPPEPKPEPEPEPEEKSDSGTIIFGYMWSAISKTNHIWYAAGSYCENLDELGYSDWRLPELNELRVLITGCSYTAIGGECNFSDSCLEQEWEDESLYCAANNCGCIYDGNSFSKLGDMEDLWTATPRKQGQAWHINFSEARIRADETDLYKKVRCLRNPE